jgi:hypothetical protein
LLDFIFYGLLFFCADFLSQSNIRKIGLTTQNMGRLVLWILQASIQSYLLYLLWSEGDQNILRLQVCMNNITHSMQVVKPN